MEAIDKMIEEHPLVLFSVYTEIQKQCLFDIGDNIVDLMKKFSSTGIDGTKFIKAYGLIWLWILGSYEVLRTMDDPKAINCFDKKTKFKLTNLRIKLAKIRMPLAKQEKKGKKEYVRTEPSITSYSKGDIGFTIDGEKFFFKPLFKELKDFMSKIKPINIKATLGNLYKNS